MTTYQVITRDRDEDPIDHVRELSGILDVRYERGRARLIGRNGRVIYQTRLNRLVRLKPIAE